MTSIIALSSALWLGILTSISPCPLATNIAAVSFIARRCGRAHQSLLSGLLYALGRMLVYVVIGALAVFGLLNLPVVSHFLQQYSGKILGPLLILVGMVLVDLIRFRLPNGPRLARLEEKAATWGHPGAFALGVLFALAFCPVSAALFFGALIPAAMAEHSAVAMPSAYGLGTGLPVVVFAVLFAAGLRRVGLIVHHLSAVELWARRVTGALFILIGMYSVAVHIFKLWP